jgi:hypothetical protein
MIMARYERGPQASEFPGDRGSLRAESPSDGQRAGRIQAACASGSHRTPRWREMDSNLRSPVTGAAILSLFVRGPLVGKGIMRSNNGRRLERNRKFVDSSLEGAGFELLVPQSVQLCGVNAGRHGGHIRHVCFRRAPRINPARDSSIAPGQPHPSAERPVSSRLNASSCRRASGS